MSDDQATKLTAKAALVAKRAVIYCRVSTDEQAESGYSLPTQLEACRQYAKQQGFVVVAEFKEDYTGTVPIEERPEGRKLYAMLRNGDADAMIAYNVKRMVRPKDKGDEIEVAILWRNFAKLEAELHTVERGQIKSFLDVLIALLDAKSSGDELRAIVERTNRGKREKARMGKVVGSGPPPYGYRYKREVKPDGTLGKIHQLEIIDQEAAIVRMIYQWYLVGNEDGNSPMSTKAIAKKLSAMRILSPGETRGRKRKRKSGMWAASTVGKILTNETYAGIWRYNKYKDGEMRAKEEHIEVEVPAIISRADWEAAQKRGEHNRRMSKRNCQHEYLLRGRVKCICGFNMVGNKCRNPVGAPYYYYRCNSSAHRFPEIEGRTCTQKAIPCDILDTIAWNYVWGIMTDKDYFQELLIEAQRAELDALEPKRERLATIEGFLSQCEQEAEDIARSLKSARGIVGKKLERDMREVNTRYEALTRERDNLVSELETAALTDTQIANTLRFQEDAIIGMQEPTFENKRQTLEDLNVQIVVDGDKAHASCRIPAQEQTFETTSL